MASHESYRAPTAEPELAAVGEVMADSFGFPVQATGEWFTNAGHQNLRGYWRADELVAALILVPMGAYFGGRPVSLMGFSGVVTAAHARGGGLGTRMMAEALRESRSRGFALAGLYPATQPVYRKVGFEQAGSRFEIRVPIASLPSGFREGTLRPVRDSDWPAIHALYAGRARAHPGWLDRAHPGWLDRGPYVWARVRKLREMVANGYVLEGPSGLDGYLFAGKQRGAGLGFDLLLTDFAYRSEAAARRWLSFLADHASMAKTVTWYGQAEEPLLQLLREQDAQVRQAYAWMLRLLDVRAALTGRGYPRAVTASLDLELTDPLFPENAGRFRLEVSGGEGRLTEGGSGALRADVRAFAPVYSGFRSARALAQLGALTATPDALDAADAIFAGPPPSCPDMY